MPDDSTTHLNNYLVDIAGFIWHNNNLFGDDGEFFVVKRLDQQILNLQNSGPREIASETILF